MSQKGSEHEVLGDEYEHVPVPLSARRSTFSVSMVWLGFPMIITGAMTGSIMVAGMGFQSALLAMLIGNALMFAYVGSLGLLGTARGFNIALIASAVFGKKGYVQVMCSPPGCCQRCCSAGMPCKPASPAT